MSAPVVLSGWGIAPSAVAEFFPAGTRVFAPTRENVAKLKDASQIVGYSLGAWLLLDAAARGEISSENVTLYAPFLAFPAEAGMGGKISLTQVKFLRRWVKKDPAAALADFYTRAALSFPKPSEVPYALEDLDAGLALLSEARAICVPEIAKKWTIVLGEDDGLLNTARVAETFSENPLCRVSAGTHDLLTLV